MESLNELYKGVIKKDFSISNPVQEFGVYMASMQGNMLGQEIRKTRKTIMRRNEFINYMVPAKEVEGILKNVGITQKQEKGLTLDMLIHAVLNRTEMIVGNTVFSYAKQGKLNEGIKIAYEKTKSILEKLEEIKVKYSNQKRMQDSTALI